MKQKKGFVMRDVCGENAIIGEGLEAVNFNKLIALNDTAAWLWEKAAELGDFTAQQLADALCQEYDVTPERALADVEKLIASWQSAGIVE
jgi:predicted transcriptional regulator